MSVRLAIGANAPLFTPESKNVWTDVESIRPCRDSSIESNGGKCSAVAKRFNDRPMVLGQEVCEIQHGRKAVGVDDLQPMTSRYANACHRELHGKGSIFVRGSDFSRRAQLASSSDR